MKKATFTINSDVKCKQCGKGGAAKTANMDDYGICIECATLNMGKLNNMKIGPKTRKKAVELFERILNEHQESINQTFSDFGNKLGINIGIVFESEKDRGVNVSVKYKYVEKEVKGILSEIVDEEQIPIEFPEKKKK